MSRRTFKYLLTVLVVLFGSTSVAQHFRSGFEGTTKVVRAGSRTDDIRGGEVISNEYFDWKLDLENNPNLGNFETFQIYYQAGKKEQRNASIVIDPLDPLGKNHVLRFQINQAYASVPRDESSPKLGRIAAQFVNEEHLDNQETGFVKLHYGFKMLLPNDYYKLKNDTLHNNSWYTIAEFWNNGNWGDFPHPYRIKLDLVKKKGLTSLQFVIKGEFNENGKWVNDWTQSNNWYNVPLGVWLDMDIYFKEGSDRRGRFVLKVNNRTIIRVKNNTHHPDAAGRGVDGMTHMDLLKLYTGGDQIDHMLELGVKPTIYWDDFIIYDDRKTEIRTSFWRNNSELDD